MRQISVVLTKGEIVKLISCCDQVIVRNDETLRIEGNVTYVSHGFTLKDSIDKFWDIKDILKNAIISHMETIIVNKLNNITLTMVSTDMIKLRAICNGAIEYNEDMIRLIGVDSTESNFYKDEITKIEEIKEKLKLAMNRVMCIQIQYKGEKYNAESNNGSI